MDIHRWLEWDQLVSPIEFRVDQQGDLTGQVERGIASRGPNLEIAVEFTGKGKLGEPRPEPKLRKGERRPAPPEITGTTQGGSRITLKWVTPENKITRGDGLLTIPAKCFEIQVETSPLEVMHHIDWLVNYSTAPFHLPARPTERSLTNKYTRSRDHGPTATIELPQLESTSSDHFRVQFEINSRKQSIAIGKTKEGMCEPALCPGFIEYTNELGYIPDEDERWDVLVALSFILGRRLIPIGSTSYSKDWRQVRATSKEAQILTSLKRFRQPCMPPANLSMDGNFIDEQKTARAVTRFLEVSKSIDLENSMWLYWIGNNTTLETAPALYGAAIESLRNSYFKSEKEKSLKTKILPEAAWPGIKDKLTEALREAEKELLDENKKLPEEYVKPLDIFHRKITQFNDKSSSMKTPEFFEIIGLPIGKVEENALKERNRPAHGHRYHPDQYDALNAANNALITLLNRVILNFSGAADTYIDYSTLGHPTRKLEEPLGGPEGDGCLASSFQ